MSNVTPSSSLKSLSELFLCSTMVGDHQNGLFLSLRFQTVQELDSENSNDAFSMSLTPDIVGLFANKLVRVEFCSSHIVFLLFREDSHLLGFRLREKSFETLQTSIRSISATLIRVISRTSILPLLNQSTKEVSVGPYAPAC